MRRHRHTYAIVATRDPRYGPMQRCAGPFAYAEVAMAQVPPSPVVLQLRANTSFAMAALALLGVACRLGWKPSAMTIDRVGRMIARTVSIRTA